jgi:hypothetical protein
LEYFFIMNDFVWVHPLDIGQIKQNANLLLSNDNGNSGTIYDVMEVEGTELKIKPYEIITEDGTVTLPIERPTSTIDYSIPAIQSMVYVKGPEPEVNLSTENPLSDSKKISEEKNEKARKDNESLN